MNLKALRDRITAIREEATAIVDAGDTNGGSLTTEQQAKFDGLMEERATVEGNIKRLEQLEDLNKSAGRTVPAVAPAAMPAPSGVIVGDDRSKIDPMAGFASAAEFGLAVRAASNRAGGVVDERLSILGAPTNFHRETGSSDGYMVPPQVKDDVWAMVHESGGLLDRVAPEPTESNTIQFGTDESTPWSSDGVQAYWSAEGDQLTGSRLATTGRTMQLHKLHAMVTATDEILEDAPRLQNRLTVKAAEAIAYKADEALVNGDGVGKPLGWRSSDCLVTQAKETSQTAATIVTNNVTKMYSRLLAAGGLDRAFWLINQDAFPELVNLTIGDRPVFIPPGGGLNVAPSGGMLLGLPVVMSDHAETLGAAGDVTLVNPRGYAAAVKASGLKFSASMHLYFDYDVEAFKWTFRLGGQPVLSAAVSPDKGSSTRSHFVTLAARA